MNHRIRRAVQYQGNRKAKPVIVKLPIEMAERVTARLQMGESLQAITGVKGSVALEFGKIREGRKGNSTQEAFEQYCSTKGWSFQRSGWPDYLCWNPATKETAFVEVKHGTDALRVNQRRMMMRLISLGLSVYVWKDGEFLRIKTSADFSKLKEKPDLTRRPNGVVTTSQPQPR